MSTQYCERHGSNITRHKTGLGETKEESTSDEASIALSQTLTDSDYTWLKLVSGRLKTVVDSPQANIMRLNQVEGLTFFKSILLGTSKRM